MTNLPQYAPARPGHPSGFEGGTPPFEARRPRGGFVLDVLVFVIPCLFFLEAKVVGRLFGTEILILAVFPFVLLTRGRLLWTPAPRTIILLGLLWLLGQVTTDLIRDTPFQDYARGWAKIGFTLINFSVLYLLLHDSARRLVIFAAGLGIGLILDYYITPGVLAAGDPWKFGLGAPLTLLLVVGAQHLLARTGRLAMPVLLGSAAAIHLALGFRSLAGICFITAVYLFFQWRRTPPRIEVSPGRLAILVAIVIAASVAFVEAYGYAARTGMLGADAQRKYEVQAASQYGLILGGRPEILVAIQAIMDSPVIGHGSWAKGADYAALLFEFKGYGPWVMKASRGKRLIPSHSHLFGAWVEAGIVGAVFWLAVLWLTIRVMAHLHQMPGALTPLIAFICFVLLWDVLFSPFGAERRVFVPYYLVVLLFAWEHVLALRWERATVTVPR